MEAYEKPTSEQTQLDTQRALQKHEQEKHLQIAREIAKILVHILIRKNEKGNSLSEVQR